MEQKLKISSLSRGELTKLLTDCFFLVGKDMSKLNPTETETMLKEIYHWKGWMWVDSFKEAFSGYAAGELEIENFHPMLNPMTVSKITKAYQDKTFGKKEKNIHHEPEFIPSSDEGYYNSLVCVMEGRKSERFNQHFPTSKPLRDILASQTGGLPVIPFTWAWDCVYRYLRTLNACDVSETPEGQKKSVIDWIRIKYVGAVFQADYLPESFTGKAKTLKEFLHYS